MKSIEAYGYIVVGCKAIIEEIEYNLTDRSICINWNNFNNGDSYWDDNGDEYTVKVDHDKKTVFLFKE